MTRIDVAFTVPEFGPAGRVCVVVDVLRFSSSVVTMFHRGLDAAILARSLTEARRIARRESALLCGERSGLAPAGFDYGNSPAQFARLDLSGRRAVCTTSNGTAAVARAAGAEAVFVGSLLNCRATAVRALREARKRRAGIAILCAGEQGGARFSLEDAFCAGALVESLGEACQLGDSARAALLVYKSYRRSGGRALRQSAHGAALIALGFERDVAFCARRNLFDVVPRLSNAGGALCLTA
jgi:2-phosphosulfolactate phosphatase